MKNLKNTEMNMTLAEIFDINAEPFQNESISNVNFSNRVYHSFMRQNIKTVYQLLQLTPSHLIQIKSLGKKSLAEIYKVCKEYFKVGNYEKYTAAKKHITPNLKLYVKKMVFGDFESSEREFSDNSEIERIEKYKIALQILGNDIAIDCMETPQKIVPIIEMLKDFQRNLDRKIEIEKLLDNTPDKTKNNLAEPYIFAYTINDMELRKWLSSLISYEGQTLINYANNVDITSDYNYKSLYNFLSWCSIDVRLEIEELFQKIYKKPNEKLIIRGRSKDKTLEQLGFELGITRERVRQIESRVKSKFEDFQNRRNIVLKISADVNGDKMISVNRIASYSSDNISEFIFLLKNCKNSEYTYDNNLDTLIIGNDSIYNRIKNCVDNLPNLIKAEHLSETLTSISDMHNIPNEMLEKVFYDTYNVTGKVFHRSRLLLTEVYENIIKDYYANGIHIYDEEELNRFRKLIISEYGDIPLPESNRALSARISEKCILSDRGVYKAKQQEYISKKLSDKIFGYIKYGNNDIYMTNAIFAVFEKELVEEGVKNKYYLQGILHEMFGDEFIFRRDYISKDPNFTSVYSSIIKYIQKYDYPLSKDQLKNQFPGITEIVFTIALDDAEIINLFGKYLHSSYVRVDYSEKQYLRELIDCILSDNEAHHIKDIYEIITREKPEIFTRNSAMFPFGAFSILEFLFKNEFQFLRPYIAKNDVEIDRPSERLHDLIYSRDEFTVSEISEFVRYNHFQINSLLEYVNGCNDEFLLVDDNTMMKIDKIGIDEAIANQVEDIISKSISETTLVKSLTIWSELPTIKVSWTEWLVYSVIIKWGKSLVAATSSNQFRLSVPLVAPIGKYDPYAFKDIDKGEGTASFIVDDLSNMDALLEEIMDDNFLNDF